MVDIINIGPWRLLWGIGNQWSFFAACGEFCQPAAATEAAEALAAFGAPWSNCTRAASFQFYCNFHRFQRNSQYFSTKVLPEKELPIRDQISRGVIIFPGPRTSSNMTNSNLQQPPLLFYLVVDSGHRLDRLGISNEEAALVHLQTCKLSADCLINLQKNGEPSIRHVRKRPL